MSSSATDDCENEDEDDDDDRGDVQSQTSDDGLTDKASDDVAPRGASNDQGDTVSEDSASEVGGRQIRHSGFHGHVGRGPSDRRPWRRAWTGSEALESCDGGRRRGSKDLPNHEDGGRRRGSKDLLNNEDGRRRRESKDFLSNEEHTPTLGDFTQWSTRLLSSSDLRTRQREFCRQIVVFLEANMPLSGTIDPTDKVRLVDNVENKVHGISRVLLQSAHSLLASDLEELQALRKTSAEVEARVANMNMTYLKELSANRDSLRNLDHEVDQALKGAEMVQFYEPLQYLPEEVKSTAMAVVDEKLKALFVAKPNLQNSVNSNELSKFEDAIVRDKLKSIERVNANLREEIREYQTRAKKAEAATEKQLMETGEVRHKLFHLKAQIEELESEKALMKPQVIGKDMATQTRKRNEEAEVQAGVGFIKWSRDKGQQTDPMLSPPETGSNAVTDSMIRTMAAGTADLTMQLREAKRDEESMRAQLGLRDDRIAELEDELAGIKARHDEQVGVLCTERDATIDALRAERDAAMDEVAKGQDEFDKVDRELRIVRSSYQTMRERLETCQEQLAKAEQRRNLLVETCQQGAVPQEFVDELQKELKEKQALAEELDQFKAALSMEVSRRSALELALAAKSVREPPSSRPSTIQNLAMVQKEAELRFCRENKADEKVEIQKAQLDTVLRDNQVLQLTLEEMQQDMRQLTAKLRAAMPAAEVLSPDLESVLGRMERVVRDGGGAYLRLHKDAQLREIATETKRARRARAVELSEDEVDPSSVVSRQASHGSGALASRSPHNPLAKETGRQQTVAPRRPEFRKKNTKNLPPLQQDVKTPRATTGGSAAVTGGVVFMGKSGFGLPPGGKKGGR